MHVFDMAYTLAYLVRPRETEEKMSYILYLSFNAIYDFSCNSLLVLRRNIRF